MGEFMGRAWEHGAWSTKTTKGFRSYKLFVCSMIQDGHNPSHSESDGGLPVLITQQSSVVLVWLSEF